MEKKQLDELLVPSQIEGLLKTGKHSGAKIAEMFSNEIKSMIANIDAIQVDSVEKAKLLADLLVKGRAGFAKIEEMRKTAYAPYKVSVDNINEYWKKNFMTKEFADLLDKKKKELAEFEKQEKIRQDKIEAQKKREIEEKAKEDARKFQLFDEMQKHFQAIIDALISCELPKELAEVFHTYLNPQNTEVIAKKDLYCKYWEDDYNKLYAKTKEIGATRANEIKNNKPVSEELVIKQQEIIQEQHEREEEVAESKLDAEISTAKAITVVEAEKPKSSTYERFTWEGVIDKTINDVDRKFLELSPSAIDEYIKKNKANLVEGAVVGGIRFIKRSITVLK